MLIPCSMVEIIIKARIPMMALVVQKHNRLIKM
jgi:hypothetical protein